MNKRRHRKWGKDSEQGAALVEFAIVVPLLLMLIFGMIEFGVLLYDKAMITNASREGARAGIVFGRKDIPGLPPQLPDTLVEDVVASYCADHLITFGATSSLTITTGAAATPADTPVTTNFKLVPSGEYLVVEVIYPYAFLLVPNFITNITGTVNLTAVTRMRAE